MMKICKKMTHYVFVPSFDVRIKPPFSSIRGNFPEKYILSTSATLSEQKVCEVYDSQTDKHQK